MTAFISKQAVLDRKVEVPMFGKMVEVVAVSEIERIPVDYYKVSRCKDCEHFYDKDASYASCDVNSIFCSRNHFCAYWKERT